MTAWSKKFETAVRANLLSVEPDIDLSPATSFAELALDSLSIMTLITELECSFEMTMPETALMNGFDTTLGELWSYCVAATSVPSAQ